MSALRNSIICLLLAGMLTLLFFNISYAQLDKGVPVDCQGDRIEYSEAKGQIKIIGNVIVCYKDIKITADKAIAYPQSKEIYARGNVTLYKDEGVFKADKIYYNFETKKGTLIHGDFKSGEIFGEAKRLDGVSDKELVALEGHFTTCEFDIPHYRIQAKRIKIYLGEKVVATNIFFYVGNMPIMYLPYYCYSLKDKETGLRVTPGHSKDWGYFVLTSLRYYFNEYSNGYLHFDWREKLGVGGGFDYKYDTKKYGKGLLKAYYTQERDKELQKEGLPFETQKYRVKLEHSWNIDSNTRALLEVNKYDDKDFIKDYFYKEYIKDPLPTSYISVIRQGDYYSLSFLARKRINDFRTITETLPELKFNVNNYKLGDTKFYYTSEYRFNNLSEKIADTDIDYHTTRFHTDNRLTYPTRLMGYLNWLKFTPYAGRIGTFYTRDRDGSDRDFFRGLWYAGYDLTTKIYRMFDIEGSYFGTEINRLRHLIIPTVSYTYQRKPNVVASRLYQFDSIDSYDDEKYYTFSIENKLQTKWHTEDSHIEEEIDLISFRNSVKLYPQIEGNQFSNITSSLELRPKRWLEFNFDSSYNPHSDDFEIFNAGTKLTKDKWSLALSSRYTKGTDTQDEFAEGIVDATYTLTPKWKIGVFERYNFDKGDLEEYQYKLTRDLHCWTAELTYHFENESGPTMWLIFKTKAFPEFPVAFGT